MAIVQVRCPSCNTLVWAKANAPCPSCRKTIPADIWEVAAEKAGVDEAASSNAETAFESAGESRHFAGPAENSTTETVASSVVQPTKPKTRAVQRTNWAVLVFGLVLMLIAGGVFFAGGDSDTTPSKSRRVRALENAIGEDATRILSVGVCLLAGAFMVYASRVTMTEAAGLSDESHSCSLCGKAPPGNNEAFINVGGGRQPFPAAFRCHACDTCLTTASGLKRKYVLHVGLGLLLIFLGMPLTLAGLSYAFSSTAQPKPGAGTIFGIASAVVVFLAVSVVWLHFQTSRGTARLLGQRLDETIRQTVGIRRWRWPRFISVSRQVVTGRPTIDVT
jgi:hypothetical protein